LRPFLDAIDERVLVCDGGIGPFGIRVEPRGRVGVQFSSILGVLEAIG